MKNTASKTEAKAEAKPKAEAQTSGRLRLLALLLALFATTVPHPCNAEADATMAPATMPRDYLVQAGDTGMKISKKFRTSFSQLQKDNPNTDWTKLPIGSRLQVRLPPLAVFPPQEGAPTHDAVPKYCVFWDHNKYFQISQTDALYLWNLLEIVAEPSKVEAKGADAPPPPAWAPSFSMEWFEEPLHKGKVFHEDDIRAVRNAQMLFYKDSKHAFITINKKTENKWVSLHVGGKDADTVLSIVPALRKREVSVTKGPCHPVLVETIQQLDKTNQTPHFTFITGGKAQVFVLGKDGTLWRHPRYGAVVVNRVLRIYFQKKMKTLFLFRRMNMTACMSRRTEHFGEWETTPMANWEQQENPGFPFPSLLKFWTTRRTRR